MDWLPSNPFRVRGYEKFWISLLAGNSVQVPITLTLILIASTSGIPDYMPTTEIIITQVGIFWAALWAALGAYLGTTTEPADGSTEAEPQEGNSEPVPADPVTPSERSIPPQPSPLREPLDPFHRIDA